MLYTRKGDKGTTKILHCDQQLSKSSAVAEALGAVDELNSLLGFVKVKSSGLEVGLPSGSPTSLINQVQQNLFIIQAELAGAPGKTITADKIEQMEKIIDGTEKELPPIKSFFVAGGTELGALFDYARTVARRAERRVVACLAESAVAKRAGRVKLGKSTMAYLNRLSSFLYALARLVNYRSGIKEEPPNYQ